MSLTPKEQRAVLDGDFPTLIGLDRFEVGQTLEVTSRVSVRIEKRNLRKGKVQWDYTVIDNRDRVLRFRPPARGKQVPAEELSATEIERASEQSAYDGNPRDPMDAGLCIPPEVQNVFALESRARWSGYMEAERTSEVTEQRAKQLTRRLRRLQADAAKHGVDIAPHLLGMIREAEAEVAKRRAA